MQKINSFSGLRSSFFLFLINLFCQKSQLILIKCAPNFMPSLLAGIVFCSLLQLMLSTLHVMRQQLKLHVGWHVPLPWRRMQGQGLNCISRVIISLEMDHDKNECLGPCAALDWIIPVLYIPPYFLFYLLALFVFRRSLDTVHVLVVSCWSLF